MRRWTQLPVPTARSAWSPHWYSIRPTVGRFLSRSKTCITLILGADVVPVTEGNTDGRDNASAQTARRGLRHWHVRTLFAREPGDLMVGQRQHACCTGPCREGEEP